MVDRFAAGFDSEVLRNTRMKLKAIFQVKCGPMVVLAIIFMWIRHVCDTYTLNKCLWDLPHIRDCNVDLHQHASHRSMERRDKIIAGFICIHIYIVALLQVRTSWWWHDGYMLDAHVSAAALQHFDMNYLHDKPRKCHTPAAKAILIWMLEVMGYQGGCVFPVKFNHDKLLRCCTPRTENYAVCRQASQ